MAWFLAKHRYWFTFNIFAVWWQKWISAIRNWRVATRQLVTGLWMWKSWMLEDDICISFSFSQQQPDSSWGNGADCYWKFLMRRVSRGDLIGWRYVRVPRSSKVAAEFPKGKTRLDIGFQYDVTRHWLRNNKMANRRKNYVKCTKKVLGFFRVKKVTWRTRVWLTVIYFESTALCMLWDRALKVCSSCVVCMRKYLI